MGVKHVLLYADRGSGSRGQPLSL